MRPTWPFLELFAFLGLFHFCAALRAEIEHWLFWILGMVFSLGKQSVIAMFSFALRHHPLLWEVSWALATISAVTSDYWPDSHLHCDIATKEPLTLANVLESSASSISNSWVDVFVNSM